MYFSSFPGRRNELKKVFPLTPPTRKKAGWLVTLCLPVCTCTYYIVHYVKRKKEGKEDMNNHLKFTTACMLRNKLYSKFYGFVVCCNIVSHSLTHSVISLTLAIPVSPSLLTYSLARSFSPSLTPSLSLSLPPPPFLPLFLTSPLPFPPLQPTPMSAPVWSPMRSHLFTLPPATVTWPASNCLSSSEETSCGRIAEGSHQLTTLRSTGKTCASITSTRS